MRRIRRIAGVLFLIACSGPGARPAEESFGTKVKKIFAPTPTPAPRKHRKSSNHQEKRGRREVADAKALAFSREIAVAFALEKEKSLPESQPNREPRSNRVPFAGEKEGFADSGSGFFAESFPKEEKETQTFSFPDSGGSLDTFTEPCRHSRRRRNAQRHAVTLSIGEEKGGAGHRRGQ